MCIPNLLSKAKIPRRLPSEMKKEVKKLKKLKSSSAVLREAYNFIAETFGKYSRRHMVVARFFRLFLKDVGALWSYKYKGDHFLHCLQLNYLLRVLLIKSGKFKEKDIGLVDIFHMPFSIHQYLVVRVGKKWVDVDVWYSKLGVPFGQHRKYLFRIWKVIF